MRYLVSYLLEVLKEPLYAQNNFDLVIARVPIYSFTVSADGVMEWSFTRFLP